MKKKIFLFLIALLISGCYKDHPTTPEHMSPNGQLTLKLDKTSVPPEITAVTAYLLRSGYNTITGSLNLLSDSTADISLSSIPEGQWHLKVDATDSLNVTRYSGETDVQVIQNQTVQVVLTLVPVSSGVGNIYLYVTWGTSSSWLDYPGNPVISGVYSRVIYDDNKYKIWFTKILSGGVAYIYYSESLNGISWNSPINYPVLSPGQPGSWDDLSVGGPCIIKENNIYKMFYAGRRNHLQPWHIGLATSSDGINWIKYSEPVLSAGTGWEYQLYTGDIIKKNDTYFLYYTGVNYTGVNPVPASIGLATSSDGVNFNKSSANPILIATQLWETHVMYPSVHLENGTFKMIYSEGYWSGFGEASSVDGINWTKSGSNPFFKSQNTYNQWTNEICNASYVNSNGEIRIYYSAHPGNQGYSIGFIKKGQ